MSVIVYAIVNDFQDRINVKINVCISCCSNVIKYQDVHNLETLNKVLVNQAMSFIFEIKNTTITFSKQTDSGLPGTLLIIKLYKNHIVKAWVELIFQGTQCYCSIDLHDLQHNRVNMFFQDLYTGDYFSLLVLSLIS